MSLYFYTFAFSLLLLVVAIPFFIMEFITRDHLFIASFWVIFAFICVVFSVYKIGTYHQNKNPYEEKLELIIKHGKELSEKYPEDNTLRVMTEQAERKLKKMREGN